MTDHRDPSTFVRRCANAAESAGSSLVGVAMGSRWRASIVAHTKTIIPNQVPSATCTSLFLRMLVFAAFRSGNLLLADSSSDHDHGVGLERLHDPAERAQVLRPLEELRLAFSREHHDRKRRMRGLPSQCL